MQTSQGLGMKPIACIVFSLVMAISASVSGQERTIETETGNLRV
jgi:hypothetical protein